ncbi:alpha-ketoacid dehydrogenase subunit alpha/beta [Rhodohalobacter mucosus]|uniref:3-methyl-2-oxobutanoate dehydrogenase (2-methylpropanoyl-transferring) n=1 Tax=Rhodohalobacter mucosus TaxID=2079485 RepID=A0A316TNJ4_9BACT|nr:alpha-ketoacid dehydrogenase subunit alpha/beta [Rhodohalobacter mucosus]PWN06173.1 transketolase [Rhodohalobacter mucosus]
MKSKEASNTTYSKKQTTEILNDFKLACMSRQMSLLGRKEVLTGKAKFGIFGDGKELPQLVLAKFFKKGDFRSGYYRDQTLMMAIGELTVEQFFAQLYANPSLEEDPHSGGRQMNAHFATRLINEDGSWKDQTATKNTSADLSPTAGQMPRLLGLAQASKVYRENELLKDWNEFSDNGNEIAWGTIGDASTSEGLFWETVNAAGVLQVPMVLSVWDDGYGISVAKKYQTTKESISKVLRGFKRTKSEPGFEIFTVKAWDYEELLTTYHDAQTVAREEHVPVLIHVEDVTQPQGHSTSGSHERYKNEERLEWEVEHCCINKFKNWIQNEGIAGSKKLQSIEDEAKKEVKEAQKRAWQTFQEPIKQQKEELLALFDSLLQTYGDQNRLTEIQTQLKRKNSPLRKDVISSARRALFALRGKESQAMSDLKNWLESLNEENNEFFNSNLYSETPKSPVHVEEVPPQYDEEAKKVDGRMVLRDNFDTLFEKNPNTIVFGEDVGTLGGVNLGLEGLQEKYGKLRVSDTGIREATILGQGMGMALRGLRPIAEIQYLDYLLYCFQGLSDDVATIRYRTVGGQAYPLIVRTRGHRLEGIWHSGSPMGVLVNGLRGVHVCVPRNLTDAAGFYNTLLQGDDPALVIEPLNAYRLKEKLPQNLGEFTVPLGIPKIIREGTDITVVSYGSTCNIIESVLPDLEDAGISVELIDVRTLLPFDRNNMIVESLKKTNRILFVDEDVPGGGTGFMMQQVIDGQGGYRYLDSEAKCLSAKDHRPAYASDGDYFSKPAAEDIIEAIYEIMHEANPAMYPSIR